MCASNNGRLSIFIIKALRIYKIYLYNLNNHEMYSHIMVSD